MSTPKTAKILNPRIKISKTGRPYIDVVDLVKTMFEGIEKPDHEGQIEATENRQQSNGNIVTNGENSPTTNATPK